MALASGAYSPKDHEQKILNWWLENGYYKPEYHPTKDQVQTAEEMKVDGRTSWTLICPPPNAYARPHIGNISGYGFQDAMARYQRMQGKKVLVLPGKDHAGLEGEGVFVREVLEKQGRKKFDMKREDFYAEMMEYFKKNMDIARNDEKHIGLSADFDRDTFTLDPAVVDTVLETFIEMFEKKMIYKGVRIVNWDPKARTAVADNQIEYQDAVTPFVYFKYSFLKPEEKALELKEKFEGKETLWKVKENNEKNSYLLGERHDGVKVLGIAYDNVPAGNEVNGEIIGIQMRLDGDFHLVVKGIDFEGDIHEEIKKASVDMFKETAGAHIIVFNDYKEDKFYTNGFILGTVRPETKFGDTALAVDPKDDRYKDYVGKKIRVQTLNGEADLNIVSDYMVDKDFGTGMVKVTPAHSQTDWEIAQRHPAECLPAKQVIGYDLKLNHLTGKYSGINIKEARGMITQDMKENGMLIFIDEKYQNRIQIAERTKAPIEPLLSSQWYLSYDVPVEEGGKTLRQAALDMVKSGEVTIHPENMVAKFNHWMENLRDWAISRSLWWGYRLPVWYAGKVSEEIDENGQVKEFIEIDGKKEELDYTNKNHLRASRENPGEGWIQDENVLDTWFSSGQWVYATLNKYNLMDQFFPTDTLVSAHDILENWDSRMMMFTYFKHKQIPFKNLYLTGLVLGKDGQKMSKSKGNIIDIDKVVNDYGTDAVRMSFFYQNSAGGNYAITEDKLKNFKQFMNKIWNAAKFVEMSLEEKSKGKIERLKVEDLKLDFSKKLIEHVESVKENVTKNIDAFEFGRATDTLYQEFWHTFCDVLIEESKEFVLPKWNKETREVISQPEPEKKGEVSQVMLFVLKSYLKMLHPFIPFITQAIWDEMPKSEEEHKVLMYTAW